MICYLRDVDQAEKAIARSNKRRSSQAKEKEERKSYTHGRNRQKKAVAECKAQRKANKTEGRSQHVKRIIERNKHSSGTLGR